MADVQGQDYDSVRLLVLSAAYVLSRRSYLLILQTIISVKKTLSINTGFVKKTGSKVFADTYVMYLFL